MADAHDAWVQAAFGIDVASYRAAAAGHSAAEGGGERLAKARQVWLATRNKIEADIAKLRSSLASAYKGHDLAAQLEQEFNKRVEPVLGKLDTSLAHKLDEVAASTGEKRAALAKEADAIITWYEQFLDTDDVIDHLDRNPLAPMQIRKLLDGSLEALRKVVK